MTEDLHLLTGAYVLHALDPDERAAFEAHLADCADCRTEVRDLAATAARMGGADEVVPPPALRARVLGEVARTPQEPADQGVAPAGTADLTARRRDRATAGAGARSARTTWLAVAAGVVAVLALVLGGLLVQARSDRAALARQQQALSGVLTSGDARTVTGTVAGGGRAAIVVSDDQQKAAFVGTDLAEPPTGHTYQLWYITAAGAATSAGTFDPNAHGDAAVVLAGTPSGAATVGLTVEPAGGSAQPTTKPVLAVPIS
jgi:anti-sigma-K factor RskA